MSFTKLMSQVAMENRGASGNKNKSIGLIYKILAALRVIFTVLPQTGYIHPDEYFQSLEIMIGDIFNAERSNVWDFDTNNPIRNIVIPYVFYGPPLVLCKWILNYLDYTGTVSPYFLLMPCRLVVCAVSFLVDYSLINICHRYDTEIQPRLTLLASSFVMLIYGSRTFSNMLETVLFSLLLKTVVKDILDAEKAYPREVKLKASLEMVDNPRHRILITRQLKQLSHHNYSGSFEIAMICVLGTFSRPTFIAFAICPIFFWLYRGPPIKKLSIYTVHMRWACIVSSGFPAAIAMIIADSLYYKRQRSFDIIFNMGIKSCLTRIGDCFVITPLNFIRYNVNHDNMIQHGIHPRWLNLVNLLLLYNIVGVCFLHIVATVIRGVVRQRNMLKFDSVTGLMFVSVIVPIIILSIIPHQEPRYIIPITLPLIFLCGPILFSSTTSKVNERGSPGKVLFMIWFSLNLFFIGLYGFLHQGGVYPALKHLTSVRNDLQQYGGRMHVISSHIYSLPKSFLTNSVNSSKKSRSKKRSEVIVYPSSSTSFEVTLKQIETVINVIDKHSFHDELIYFIFPTSLTKNFTKGVAQKKLNLRYSVEVYIFSHISTEALPKFDWSWNFIDEMGLNIVRLKTTRFIDDETSIGYFETSDEPSVEDLYANCIYVF